MNFLNRIADVAILRIYKYILKCSIGHFLDDELLLEVKLKFILLHA